VLEKYVEFNGKYGYPNYHSIFQFVYTQLDSPEFDILLHLSNEIKAHINAQNEEKLKQKRDSDKALSDTHRAVLAERIASLNKLREQVKMAEDEVRASEQKLQDLAKQFDQLNDSIQERSATIRKGIERTIYHLK
jgi:septal ring factor EnvC (AmiA/AmiB activator)